MDLQQAKILLEKINALHKSVSLDNGEVSNIERDLMLSYIRQLYEAYLQGETTAVPTRSKTVTQQETAPPPKAKVEPLPPPPPPKVEPEPEPEPVAVAKPKPEPTPLPQTTPPAATPQPQPSANPAINALFKHQEVRELSEKLGQQTIKDLTKAMSINDKLLYSNELFGRDMAKMNDTLQQLNALGSMDEAKNFLTETAEKFDWTEEERSDVAQSFIKLVRRKF